MRLWATSCATAAQSCVRSFSLTSISRSLWHQSAQAAHQQSKVCLCAVFTGVAQNLICVWDGQMKSFPTEDLLPKKETQANLLHAKGLLGQNARVAVLDTVCAYLP